jgi:hypothetical protein
MKTLSFAQVRDCLILVCTAASPAASEWDEYLEFMRVYTRSTQAPRVVVVTQGWVPDPRQRQTLEQVNGSSYDRAKIAVVTSSTFARGVIAAIQRMHPTYKVFAPEAIDEAFVYIDLPRGHFDEAKRRIVGMAAEVGVKPPP